MKFQNFLVDTLDPLGESTKIQSTPQALMGLLPDKFLHCRKQSFRGDAEDTIILTFAYHGSMLVAHGLPIGSPVVFTEPGHSRDTCHPSDVEPS